MVIQHKKNLLYKCTSMHIYIIYTLVYNKVCNIVRV